MNAVTDLKAVTGQDLDISLHTAFEDVEQVWRALEGAGGCYGFQRYDWTRAWYQTIGVSEGVAPQLVLVTSAGGEAVMLLPLGIVRRRMLSKLTWMGGRLSDYLGPLLGADWERHLGRQPFAALWARILKALPAVDAIVLDRLPERIGGRPNPLLQLPGQAHPSATHQATLTGDLNAFVKSRRSSKSLATDRRKERRLAEHGEIRFVVGDDPDVTDKLLEALYRQKGAGYQALGVEDLFVDQRYRDFIREACRTMPEGAFLSGLMVGEEITATCFCLVHDTRLYYLLPAYERDDLTRFGPGNVLLYRLFQWCFERGVTTFDFTLGDEPYKYFWSDQEMSMRDHFQGRTPLGHLFIAVLRLSLRTKARIKASPRLLDAMLALRRLKARL